MKLTTSQLAYSYIGAANPALSAVSLDFDSSRITGLAGANGSGKTTLIKVLLGILIDYTGTYAIDSKKVSDRFANLLAVHRIGFAPDVPVLDEVLTGWEVLSLVAELRGMSKEAFEQELTQIRELLRIESWLENQPCREYSAGMRRKTSIAVACLGERSILVLDEPTNDLDPLAVFGLKKLLAFKKSQGVGAIVSSHMLDFVENVVDDVVLLSRGVIVFSGTLRQLQDAHPADTTLDEIYFDLFNKVAEPQQEN